MLAEHKLKAFQEFITQSSKEELIWMNGFIAGLVAAGGTATAIASAGVAPVVTKVNKISILYGTETGNAKKVATGFAGRAKKEGVNVKLTALDQYRLNDLAKEEYTFIVISTQGDGEPPITAKKFYDHIKEQTPSLNKMKFSVLALGDSSYPLFCHTGVEVDERLAQLGAERIVPLQKCDVDYTDDANEWFTQVLKSLEQTSAQPAATVAVATNKPKGKKIYQGTVLTNVNLNDSESNKQTHHIEIGSDDEITYEPGDSLGLIPYNKKELVEGILKVTGADPTTEIQYKGESITLEDALTRKINIVYLPERVVKAYANFTNQEIPDTRIDLLDLLRIYPVKDAAQFEQFAPSLEAIVPRLYSISSSPEAHSGEVHITVARDKFTVNEELKFGLCSDYLSALPENTVFDFYIHKNPNFKLPAENKDVIMIGPGTGIAPFRSFLAERDSTGASGKNWLFFGDQQFVSDFLYQTEIQNWAETGVLTKVNLAFSRDQKSKIYVQHRMLEHGAELWNWLKNGAYLYICGAKEPMSKDVENTLIQIAQTYGGLSAVEAVEYIDNLKNEDRYLLDVY